MKKITEKLALLTLSDYQQLYERAWDVFDWLRNTDKQFKKDACRGLTLAVEDVSFEKDLWILIHSHDVFEPVTVTLPIQYLWMTNVEIAAERAEMEASWKATKSAERKAKLTQALQKKKQRAIELEAKERKRLRELAAKYPDEVKP